MRVILTGASGFIGQAVAQRLSNAHEVISIGRRRPTALTVPAEHIEADLLLAKFARRLPQNADAVIHLAQSEKYTAFPQSACEIFGVNVRSLAQLLDWARRAQVQTFIHASTGGVYGRGSQPFKETDPVRIEGPIAFYFRTKRMAEILAEGYQHYFEVITLRPFFVYGRGQRSDALINRLIKSVRESQPITIDGPEGMRLNPVYITDAAMSIEKALTLRESDTINIAGPQVLSIREIAETIGEAIGRRPVFKRQSTIAGDIIGDISHMVERLVPPEALFPNVVGNLVVNTL